jgi:acetyl esterase/lipase
MRYFCFPLTLSLALFSAAMPAIAADAPAPAEAPRVPVWPGVAPGSEDWKQQEQVTVAPWGDRLVRNVVQPTLELYPADAASAHGAAIIVCPGGAFRFLSIDTEGVQVARWLNSKGINAFILRYRLGETAASDLAFKGQIFAILAPLFGSGAALLEDMKKYAPPAIADGRQALKLVRERASEWKIDPRRVGVLGFSAGGVVATAVSLDKDAASRPDFTAAIYPGAWPIDAVPADAPPLFVAAAADDSITKSGAQPLIAAWQAAKRPVEPHIYDKGGHGFGMKKQGKPSDVWPDQFAAWLDAQGILKPSK